MIHDDIKAWQTIDRLAAEPNPDFNRLRLAHRGDDTAMWAIDQAEWRRRAARGKLAPLFAREGGDRLVFGNSLAAEQASGSLTARLHTWLADAAVKPDDARRPTMLDMTCGFGADAMEAALAGWDVTAIDINPDNAAAAAHNARALGIDPHFRAICADSVGWLREQPATTHFDVIYIDPARRDDRGKRIFSLADCVPDITAILDMVLARCSRLIIKASPMLDITATLRLTPQARDIFTVGSGGECKEVVIVAQRGGDSRSAACHSAEISPDGTISIIDIDPTAEAVIASALPELSADGTPLQPLYLLEPAPQLIKHTAASGMICSRCDAEMLNANTHLFLSGRRPASGEEFQGRVTKVEAIVAFDKRNIREAARRWPAANVAVRNFSMSAADLARRLKVKEGQGDLRLTGTRGPGDKLLLIASLR